MAAPQVASGKVTDSQVAFMVECYLRDSHFSRTLKEFRSEAARLLHPLRSVPKGARSLSAVLNDYVALKEEQISAAAEKARVEDLFHGLQEILSVYLSGVPKSAVPMGGLTNGRIVHVSLPHVQPAAMVQQSNLRGNATIQEAGNAYASEDQHIARQKSFASKRKSLDNINHENLQQGDSTMDPAKKSRRGSNVRRLSTDAPPLGNFVNVDSPTGSNGNPANKTVQPATPPMSLISSSKSQQQPQQVFSSHGLSGSPQTSSLPSEVRPSLVSPIHTSATPTPPPSVRGDCAQSHQDPQTPPPSSIKSSGTSTSAPPAANAACNSGNITAQDKNNIELQRRKVPLQNLSSSTCPYALRAHKKPSEPPCAPNCPQKATRKKAGNSKCRLLDFSAAAEKTSNQHFTSNEDNGASVSPSECVEVSTDCQQTCNASAEGMNALQFGHAPDLSPSSTQESQDSQDSQDSQASEFELPCDTFSFDELFDLDLDSSLISELEDLAAFTGSDIDPSSCLKTNEMAALPSVVAEPSTRGILVDIGNSIYPDEPACLVPQSASPSASPSKAKRPATLAVATHINKENMHSVAISSAPQTSLAS